MNPETLLQKIKDELAKSDLARSELQFLQVTDPTNVLRAIFEAAACNYRRGKADALLELLNEHET